MKQAKKSTKATLSAKQKLIKTSAEQRLQSQELAFSWQEKLFSKPKVSSQLLRQAAAILQPQTYDEVVEERSVQDWCGYPVCDRQPQKNQPRYRISLSQRKVFDQSELALYCSDDCLQKSKYFRMQLSEEPVWFRDLHVQPSIQIVLPSQNLKKVLQKEKDDSRMQKSGHQIRQDYVQRLLENIPILPTTGTSANTTASDTNHDIRIVENSSQTVDVPQAGVFDSIEGYRIQMRRKSKDSPTTLILQQDIIEEAKPVSPTTVDSETVVFDDEEALLENAMETMMMLKDLHADREEQVQAPEVKQHPPSSSSAVRTPATQAPTAQPTSNPKPTSHTKKATIVIPDIPKPSSKKKRRQVPEMSLFGKIWTMTDRLTTKATRKYFEELRQQSRVDMRELLREEGDSTSRDEASLMRGQIFSERILETYSLVRAQMGLRDTLESDILDLIQTFRFADASMVVLNSAEAYMMTLVLFKALADVTLQSTTWQQNFEACCHAIGESGDKVDACVRVLRVAST
ncbi:Rtr1/RPAP2 family-domain-containing protein [Fennellomyces sp. T-0311]|nr:Rtr1/RPAP2 family-domain-containing protein [Fennellomyces sp. T-0311]